jgi:hypothetical protein
MVERDTFWDQLPSPEDPDPIAMSNAVRLTLGEWLFVLMFTAVMVMFAPLGWEKVETFAPEPDYREPHDLSNDYWLYRRWAALAAARHDTLLVGDSVVWGEYVTEEQTLSHYLNHLAAKERCGNLGLDGAHPLALAGLIEHYAGSVTGKNVILQCNPLWLSSSRRDLQEGEDNEFNHPRLVPQFVPRIPIYKANVSERIGIVVEQHVPFNSWVKHLQQAYYGNDIPGWTLEHPYDDPLKPLLAGLPPTDKTPRHLSQPWYKSGITRQEFPWVDLDTSLQWHAFQRAVRILRGRENRVFVLVGPFNEHMLEPLSLKRYQQIKAQIAGWLKSEQIPHAVPESLPSELYGDASHPLAEGYRQLAQELLRGQSATGKE